tara:strand:- start:1129 stop:1872 length:744 start_codon:yes stop_codon:yes gene_type:complete
MSELQHDRFFNLQDQNIIEPAQRSREWFERRKGKLSGSKLSQFIFCDTNEDRVRMYEEIFEGRKKPPFPEEAKKYMLWGTEHEDTAMKTLLDHMPNIITMEAPMVQHTQVKYLAASPDGFFENMETGDRGIVEIKCPGKRKKANSKVTYYYVPQMYLEMACSGKRQALFCSWGLDTCRAWMLQWDDEMWASLSNMFDVFRRTKDPTNTATWEDFTLAQYNLKKNCHRCVDNATLLCSSSEGWITNTE